MRIELEALSGRERVLSEAEGRAGARCRNPERSEGSLVGKEVRVETGGAGENRTHV